MLKKQEGSHILTRIVSLLDFISLHQLQLHKIMLRELFTPNIQRIKSISAIGAMLQQVLL